VSTPDPSITPTLDGSAVVVTPGVTPGNQTSEYLNIRLAQLVALIVSMVALIHPGFSIAATTQSIVVSVLGLSIPLLSTLYAKFRKDVKVAAVAATFIIPPPVDTPPLPSALPVLTDAPNVAGVDGNLAASAGSLGPVVADPPVNLTRRGKATPRKSAARR
jgi:hypothetical protein